MNLHNIITLILIILLPIFLLFIFGVTTDFYFGNKKINKENLKNDR